MICGICHKENCGGHPKPGVQVKPVELPKLKVIQPEGWTGEAMICADYPNQLNTLQASHALHRIETWPELVEAVRGVLDSALGKQLEADEIPKGQLPVACGKTYLAERLKNLRSALSRAEKGA